MANPSPAPSPSTAPTSQFNRIRPKKPIDVWSTREKLCLASAVYKIGDQNWVSVSRAIKPYAEPNRSPDWFHQKNCVLQYYDMLEQLEQPKRKRGDRAETDTPSLQIMRKMTIERSEQLKKEIMEMQQEFKCMKSEAEAIDAGDWDDQLEEEWEKIQEEQRLMEEDVKIEVTDPDESAISKDAGDSILGMGELDDTTQDSIVDQDTKSTSAASTSATISSLDISKLPASSHLLSSLLQSNVKTTNELQQLKMEQENTHGQPTVSDSSSISTQQLSSQDQQSLISSLDQNQSASSMSTSISSASSVNTATSSTLLSSNNTVVPNACDVEEDNLVDVMTDVVEETIVEATDTATIVTDQVEVEDSSVVVKPEDQLEDSNSPVVEGVEEEVRDMDDEVTEIKMEVSDDISMDDGETKDSAAELDVEGLVDVKEEVDKDSQDEDEIELKQINESITAGTEIELTETALKNEPLSPTSSISSRISETGSKRGRRGKMKTARQRLGARKSYTDDERNSLERNSLRLSDTEFSEEEGRDTDDILSGGLGASATGSILSESFPNSPASLSICSDTEEEKSYKQWKKSIMLVWRAAATHKYANVFLHPVTDDIAPGYKTVVLRPMDLSTMKKNVEIGALRTTVEFQRDLMLMFSNAIMYNASNHNVNRMATEMYDDVMQHIEIMVQTTDAKSLRQSRRADTSDKEEDTKKRRLSVEQSESGKTKKRKTRLDENLPQ